MDTLDYTGPAVNEGSKGVWLGLGDPVRELPRQFTRRRRRRASPTCASSAAAVSSSAAPAYAAEPDAAARLAARSGVCRTGRWSSLTDEPARAARSDMNFLWTTFTRFEPAADIHAADRAHRAQPHRLHRPDRHRRAHEAVVSEGAVVPRRHRRAGDAALERVLPGRATSRWATPSAPISIDPLDRVSGFSRIPKRGRMATIDAVLIMISLQREMLTRIAHLFAMCSASRMSTSEPAG